MMRSSTGRLEKRYKEERGVWGRRVRAKGKFRSGCQGALITFFSSAVGRLDRRGPTELPAPHAILS